MTTSILHDEVAALEAERDLLRAQLAKARRNKKPCEEMTTGEYRAALNKLGVSINGAADILGFGKRNATRYANRHIPIPAPVAKLLWLASEH